MSQLHWSTWNQQNPCGMVPTCLAVGHLCWGCFRSTLASFPQSLRMMGRIIQEHDLAIPWGITSELQGPVKNFQLPSKLIYLLSSPRTATQGQRSRANMYVYLYIYICVCARACHCIHNMFCNSDIYIYHSIYIYSLHTYATGRGQQTRPCRGQTAFHVGCSLSGLSQSWCAMKVAPSSWNCETVVSSVETCLRVFTMVNLRYLQKNWGFYHW